MQDQEGAGMKEWGGSGRGGWDVGEGEEGRVLTLWSTYHTCQQSTLHRLALLLAAPQDGSISRPLSSSIVASAQQLRTAHNSGYPERLASGHYFEVTFPIAWLYKSTSLALYSAGMSAMHHCDSPMQYCLNSVQQCV